MVDVGCIASSFFAVVQEDAIIATKKMLNTIFKIVVFMFNTQYSCCICNSAFCILPSRSFLMQSIVASHYLY